MLPRPPTFEPPRPRSIGEAPRRVGIHGADGRGAAFARVVAEDPLSLLAYVCEARGALRAALAHALPQLDVAYGAGPAFRNRVLQVNLSRLLADRKLTGVVICGEWEVRADLVEAALGAGKHVLCDEPVAPTRARADALYALADTRERNLVVASSTRAAALAYALSDARGAMASGGPLRIRRVGRRTAPWREWLVEDLLCAGGFLGDPELRGEVLHDDRQLGCTLTSGPAASRRVVSVDYRVGDETSREVVALDDPKRSDSPDRRGALAALEHYAQAPLSDELRLDWARFAACLPGGGAEAATRLDTRAARPREQALLALLEALAPVVANLGAT